MCAIALQGIQCANVQRKKQLLLDEGVQFVGDKVSLDSSQSLAVFVSLMLCLSLHT